MLFNRKKKKTEKLLIEILVNHHFTTEAIYKSKEKQKPIFMLSITSSMMEQFLIEKGLDKEFQEWNDNLKQYLDNDKGKINQKVLKEINKIVEKSRKNRQKFNESDKNE